MKKKLDFILEQDEDERLVFRFHPRSSHCHSFNETPPKTWEEVYKVYYSYSILKQWKEDGKWKECEIVYNEPCDECSIINTIAFACLGLAKGNTYHENLLNGELVRIDFLGNTFYPMGYGTEWTIDKIERPEGTRYQFTLFDWHCVGYKFYLPEEKMEEFGTYLKSCCDYMLEHGEPI